MLADLPVQILFCQEWDYFWTVDNNFSLLSSGVVLGSQQAHTQG